MEPQISPSRWTTAAHILAPLKRPPAVAFAEAIIAALRSASLGRSLQFAAYPPTPIDTISTKERTNLFIMDLTSLLEVEAEAQASCLAVRVLIIATTSREDSKKRILCRSAGVVLRELLLRTFVFDSASAGAEGVKDGPHTFQLIRAQPRRIDQA